MISFTECVSKEQQNKWKDRVSGLKSNLGSIKFEGLFNSDGIPLFYIRAADCNGKFIDFPNFRCGHGCRSEGVTFKLENHGRYPGKEISCCYYRDDILQFKDKITEILSEDVKSNL